MTDSKTATFLRNHPKLLAALFSLTILLSQTGSVIAGGNGGSITG